MNGNTLKWAFSVIVWTFCIILLSATLLVFLGKITPEVYKDLIGNLGIIGLFTMISQSYLHSDVNKDGIPDSQQVEEKEKKDEKDVNS